MKKYIFNIFILAVIAGCVVLGLWQVKRLQWKESLISQVQKFKDEKPEEFSIKNYKPEEDLFKKVFLVGAFLHDYEILLSAKYFSEERDKNELGYHVITPFLTTEGIVVFVNRGWIPEKFKEKSSRKKSLYRTNIEIPLRGIIRESKGKAPWYMPQNSPEKNIWFWIDLPEMAKKLEGDSKLKNIQQILIQQTQATNYKNFKYPVPISENLQFYNQHLVYVITWFSLAFVIFLMWAYYLKSNKKL
jgi:surfeit locus 1 family protein